MVPCSADLRAIPVAGVGVAVRPERVCAGANIVRQAGHAVAAVVRIVSLGGGGAPVLHWCLGHIAVLIVGISARAVGPAGISVEAVLATAYACSASTLERLRDRMALSSMALTQALGLAA